MEIYLIRHTETAIGKGICYGQSDVPLKIPFLGTFNKIVRGFELTESIVYSSPLQRCSQLADHFKISNKSIKKIHSDPRLMELNFGDWEKKDWNSIDPGHLNAWMADFVNYRVPGGEAFSQLHLRVNDFMNEELIAKKHGAPVIIITHAGVIRSFLCRVLEKPLENAFEIPVDYGSVSKIVFSENNSSCNVEFTNRHSSVIHPESSIQT